MVQLLVQLCHLDINVIVKHHKNPKYARCTKWAASRKKTTSFRLIASSSNGSSFYCLYSIFLLLYMPLKHKKHLYIDVSQPKKYFSDLSVTHHYKRYYF